MNRSDKLSELLGILKSINYDEVIKISKRYMDNMEIEYYLGIVYNSKMEYQKAKELLQEGKSVGNRLVYSDEFIKMIEEGEIV